jgi:hypothetical protein
MIAEKFFIISSIVVIGLISIWGGIKLFIKIYALDVNGEVKK